MEDLAIYKPKRKRSNIESTTQRACVLWFRMQYPNYRKLLFAVPNGGLRTKKTALILKEEGVTSGVSDLVLFLPRKGFHALCIEMKTSKGRASDDQNEWAKEVMENGYKYIIVRFVDQFIDEINNYLKHN